MGATVLVVLRKSNLCNICCSVAVEALLKVDYDNNKNNKIDYFV